MPAAAPPPLKTRKPNGKMPWPCLVFAGGEKAGKTYAAIEASKSPLVHRTLLLEVGESYADAYASIPGTDYEIVEHDGTYRDIYNQLWAATTAPGGPNGEPNLIIIDSGSKLWDLIVDDLQATANARRKKDDADITMDLWNAGKKRWNRVIDLLRYYQGPSIITARYDEVTVVVGGKPTQNTEWKVRAEKNLPYDADGVVEWREPRRPRVTRMRSTKKDFGTGDGVEMPRDGVWEKLVEIIGFTPEESGKRDYIAPVAENMDEAPDDGSAPDPRFAAAQRMFDDALVADSLEDIVAFGREAVEKKIEGYPVDTGDHGRMSLRQALLGLHSARSHAAETARERADDGARPAQETAQEPAPEPEPAAQNRAPDTGPSPQQSASDKARSRLTGEAVLQASILGADVTAMFPNPITSGLASLQDAVLAGRERIIKHYDQAGAVAEADAWSRLPARPVSIEPALQTMRLAAAQS